MKTEKTILAFINFPKIIESLFYSIMPLLGMMVFKWDELKFFTYFILEIAIGFIFNFFFILFNKKIDKEIREKNAGEKHQISRIKLFLHILLAKFIIFIANFLVYSLLFIGVIFFFALLVSGENIDFLNIILNDKSIITVLVFTYALELIFSYILFGNRNKISISRINFKSYSPIISLFLTIIVGTTFYAITRNVLVFAYTLIFVRIGLVIFAEIFKGFLAFLKVRFPNLKVESSLE